MADLRQGFDVDDTNISNVEESLGSVGIKLRDSTNSFRDFSDVLEELSGKWSTLNEIQQSDIAKQIAGKHKCPNV